MSKPHLYFKYNQGLGDFVASLLHSKMLGWLTKLITGKSEPCKICSKRGEALNILFPVPFWRLFFKNEKDMISSLHKDLKDGGYISEVSEDGKQLSSIETKLTLKEPSSSQPFLNFFAADEKLSAYTFISSSDREIDHVLIRTQIFKKKS